MGIDIEGGMIVGLAGDEINLPDDWDEDEHEDFYEYLEGELEMYSYGPYYDCGQEDRVYGYRIKNTELGSKSFESWLTQLNKMKNKFIHHTGQTPKLIGMQNVW